MTGNGTKIRCETRSKGYSLVNNVLLRDKRLTPKARHIGIFMLAQADEWEFNVNGLCRVIGMIGKDSLRSAFLELETFGYLTRKRVRREYGYFTGYEYILTEEPPQNLVPERNHPLSDNPTSASGTTDLTTQIIINPTNYQSLKITNNNNGVVELIKNLKLKITSARMEKFMIRYGIQSVIKSIQYAIATMPANPRSKEGYVVDCIVKQYHLDNNETSNLIKNYEIAKAKELEIKKEKEQIEKEDEHKRQLNEERVKTIYEWWNSLTLSSKESFWQIVRNEASDLLKALLPKQPPEQLTDLSVFHLMPVVSILDNKRTEILT